MKRYLIRPAALLASALFAAALGLSAPPTDFSVESPSDGSKFSLADAKGKIVVLHFLLKTECPFCLRHTRDYAKKIATQTEVVHVFLKPDSSEEIKKWSEYLAENTTQQVVIYRDADAALAKAFDIPDGYHFHGEIIHYPALVVLGPTGKEIFRYVGKNNTDRLGFDQLATKLGELKKAGSTPTAQPASKPK